MSIVFIPVIIIYMSESAKTITCIIPAYNEGQTIAGVVEVCLKTPQINEVIVVNDGSQDDTLAKLKPLAKKIKIISLAKSRGKGYAVAQGIKAALNPYLLFLDADLLNLESRHLYSLSRPVIEGWADMTVAGLISAQNPLRRTYWRFCGQRCFQKDSLVPLIKEIEKTNYGLEVFLNEKFREKKMIIVPLVFRSEYHFVKQKKQKDWLMAYAREVWQVFQQTVSVKTSPRKKVKSEFLHGLADYLKISYQRLKKIIFEDLEG